MLFDNEKHSVTVYVTIGEILTIHFIEKELKGTWCGDLMHVSLMAPAEGTASFAAKESWGRGSTWNCPRPSYAWSKRHWQDRYEFSILQV